MSAHKTPTDSDPAAGRVSVTVTEKGPYLVYGRPPFCEQFIMPDPDNESWYFQEGRHFSTEAEPTALCRCGASQRKPYCDGAHVRADWDPQLTASRRPLLDGADKTEGATLTMTDNPQYCVFARFCHPFGGAWTLTELSSDPEARRLAVREASICPSARLTAWDKASGTPYEFRFEPSLGLRTPPSAPAAGCGFAAAFPCAAKTASSSSSATGWWCAAAGSRPTSPIATAPTPPSSGATGSRATP